MDDTCATCQTEYDHKPANTVILVYTAYPRANHIASKCPKGHLERTFAVPSVLAKMTVVPGMTVQIFEHPPAQFRAAADEAWLAVTAPRRPTDDDPPHWMLRELFDQLRDFEKNGDVA